MRVVALLLAAGRGSRMGALKQLLPLEGRPLLQHALDHLTASSVDRVVLVLGHEAGRVEEALTLEPGRVQVVRNPDWEDGLSSSLRAGLREALEADAVLVALGDLPRIPPEVIDRLVGEARRPGVSIAAPAWRGRRGHPVLFRAEHFGELESLEGDRGAQAVLQAHPDRLLLVPVETEGVVGDVDRPEDLAAAAEGQG